MACLHPTVEGVFITLPDVDLPHTGGCGCYAEICTTEYLAQVDKLFEEAQLPIRTSLHRPSTECWIAVTVVQMPQVGVNLDGEWDRFVGMNGVYLTGGNCD